MSDFPPFSRGRYVDGSSSMRGYSGRSRRFFQNVKVCNIRYQIENDSDLNVGKARIGERIANLYVDGLIQNKDGYMLTKRGREELLGLEVN